MEQIINNGLSVNHIIIIIHRLLNFILAASCSCTCRRLSSPPPPSPASPTCQTGLLSISRLRTVLYWELPSRSLPPPPSPPQSPPPQAAELAWGVWLQRTGEELSPPDERGRRKSAGVRRIGGGARSRPPAGQRRLRSWLSRIWFNGCWHLRHDAGMTVAKIEATLK